MPADGDAAMKSFAYVVLGGGSGGIASARRAAAHGASVAVIEHGRLGGTCVNVGCVPKKLMWNAAELLTNQHYLGEYGITTTPATFDMAKLKTVRDAYVARLNGIYAANLASSGVTVFRGRASFVGPHTLRVEDASGGSAQLLEADNVLIAVGGTPSLPGVPGADLAISSDGFFDLEEVPRRVAGEAGRITSSGSWLIDV